jgi:hypothetical protein
MWDHRRSIVVVFAVAILSMSLWRWWNRPPAVTHDNLQYLSLLMTAISSRSADRLEKVDSAVKSRRLSGNMPEAEFQHFQGVIAVARDGDWDVAYQKCFEFAEAQMSRRRSPPAD